MFAVSKKSDGKKNSLNWLNMGLSCYVVVLVKHTYWKERTLQTPGLGCVRQKKALLLAETLMPKLEVHREYEIG